MKNLKLTSALVTILVLSILTSCSGSHDYKEFVNDDTATVISVNALDIITNMGIDVKGDEVVMPQELENIKNRVFTDSENKLAKIKGVDPRKIIVASSINQNGGYEIFIPLISASKFRDYLENELNLTKSTSAEGFDLYPTNGLTFAVADGLAIVIDQVGSGVTETIANMKKQASQKPIAAWKTSIIDSGKTFAGYSNIADLYSSVITALPTEEAEKINQIDGLTVVFSGVLEDLAFDFSYYLADKEGNNAFANQLKVSDKTIDKSLLCYAAPEDLAVFIGFIAKQSDWKNTLEQTLQRLNVSNPEAFINLLENVDGPFMASFGYKSIEGLAQDQYHLMVAAKINEGTADQTYKTWCSTLDEAQVPYKAVGNVIAIGDTFQVYITMRDDMLLISTDKTFPTTGSPSFTADQFGDYPVEFILRIPSNDADITYLALPFSLETKIYYAGDKIEGSLVMGDTDGKFLYNIIKFVDSL